MRETLFGRGPTETARTLGHRPTSAFRKVTLPLIALGVIGTAALVFLTTIKEFPATQLGNSTEFGTLGTDIWSVRESGYYGFVAVPTLVLVVAWGLSIAVVLSQVN